MAQFAAPARRYFPFHRVLWYVTAACAWAAFIFSAPGFYLYHVGIPLSQQIQGFRLAISAASGLASLLSALISYLLATFLYLRKPGDRAAVFVSFFLLFYGFVICGPFEMGEYLLLGQSGLYSYRFQGILMVPMTTFLLLIFPNGTITPTKFRWIVPFIVLYPLVMLFRPDIDITSLKEPKSIASFVYTLFLYCLAMGAQVYRYLGVSTPIERQQTKLVVFGIMLQSLFLFISSISWFELPDSSKFAYDPALIFTSFFWWVSISILPICLTLAVVRSHLWDIDFVIRRTLLYSLLTATLAFVYFSSVILLQSALRMMIGHESPIAIVLSTLASAAMFQPLRRHFQQVIDQRFFRCAYNFEQTLAHFQNSIRNRVEIDQVKQELTSSIQATIQPEWMSLWVKKG